MDEIDKKILRRAQAHLPLTPTPFADLGRELDLSESEVLRRLNFLREQGIIRRLGGSFHSQRLGFASTLCAAKVPPEKMSQFIDLVNKYPGVTHNYRREHEYNIWFTFTARDSEDIVRALEEIARQSGVTDILNLPALRTFKIKVDFPL